MPPSSTELEWVKPPQQTRSQQTLERILEAAEELIADGGLDTTSVKEIARRAGSSVGAFYARFPDKEALFHCLFQRFYEQAIATVDAALDPARWEDVPLEELVHTAIAFLLRVFRERSAMIAAYSVRAARDPSLEPYGRQLGLRVVERMHRLLEELHIRVSHPRPHEALGVLVWLLLSALEARALHRDDETFTVTTEQLSAELTRLCLSYLGAAPEQ